MNLEKCRVDLFLQYFVVVAAVWFGVFEAGSHIAQVALSSVAEEKANLKLLILCESPPPSARMTGAPRHAYFLLCLESAPKCHL